MNNKINYNNKKERLTGFEKNSVIIFRLIGLLFFILAFNYFFENQDGTIQKISNIMSNKHNTVRLKNSAFSWQAFNELLTYYIPIIVGMIFCIFMYKKKKLFSYYLSIIIIFATILFNSKIFISNWITNYGFCYSNYFIASAFLIIPTTLFLINYHKHKKDFLLALVSFYFYIFLFQLLIIRFSYTYLYVFSLIIIYNIVIGFITKKENSLINNWVNFLFANFFLVIYFIRQLYFNHKKESLILFFMISIAYLILFLTIGVLKKTADKKQLNIYIILNNAFFIGLNIFTLFIFSYKEYYFVPLLISLIFNSSLIFIFIKYKHNKEKIESFEFNFIFLIASFIASIGYNHSIELFLGSTAILLAFYFKYNKKNYLILGIIIPTIFLIGNLVLALISIENSITNYNDVFFKKELTDFLISICSIFLVKKIINKDLKINIPIKKRIYYDFLETLFILNSLIFLAWFIYRIEILTTKNTLHYYRIIITTLISVGIYLINYNNFISVKLSKFVNYALLISCIILPIIEFTQFPYNNADYLKTEHFLSYESILHYISLIAYIILFWKLINFSKRTNNVKKKLHLFIESISSVTLLVIICKEYDWITIIVNKSLTPIKLNNQISYNSTFPYFYIILVSSMIIFLIGAINKNKLLRIFSLTINFLIISKILYFDFSALNENGKLILLVIIGCLFIIISWLYNKIKARRKKRKIQLE